MDRPACGTRFFSSLWIVLALSVLIVCAGNTTCLTNEVDWYTNAVGETPCTTYQRLRQICNSGYQVPNFRPDTPGDNCDDQLHDCCCNSISWALSMMCMNCQQATTPTGIDAGATAYNLYRSDINGNLCQPATNESFPTNIQTSVCNANIRIDNFLYQSFWSTGDWFYVFTKSVAQQQQIQFNNNTFTHCPNQIVQPTSTSTAMFTASTVTPPHATTTAALPNASPSSSSEAQKLRVAIVVAVVGVAAFLILLLVGFCLLRRRRRKLLDGVDPILPETRVNGNPDLGMTAVTPFTIDEPSKSRSTTELLSGYLQTTGTQSTFQLPPGHPSPIIKSSHQVPERHQDAGPLILPPTPPSPSLPPAYLSWEGNGLRTPDESSTALRAARPPKNPAFLEPTS